MSSLLPPLLRLWPYYALRLMLLFCDVSYTWIDNCLFSLLHYFEHKDIFLVIHWHWHWHCHRKRNIGDPYNYFHRWIPGGASYAQNVSISWCMHEAVISMLCWARTTLKRYNVPIWPDDLLAEWFSFPFENNIYKKFQIPAWWINKCSSYVTDYLNSNKMNVAPPFRDIHLCFITYLLTITKWDSAFVLIWKGIHRS